ncbi:hypothetical protein N510_002937 [Firmicutes bacterium ASF500]|nr:hypothetical protein N510_002937 [Firmicutes bacterium ASF500]
MFWIVLLLLICFSVIVLAGTSWLGMLVGEWAFVVVGVLLLSGGITVVVSAYQRLTARLDSVEKKLDRLLEQKEEE